MTFLLPLLLSLVKLPIISIEPITRSCIKEKSFDVPVFFEIMDISKINEIQEDEINFSNSSTKCEKKS